MDKEFYRFLELCPNTSALGNRFLKYCDALKVYRKFDVVTAPQPDQDEEPAIREIFERLKEVMEQSVLSHKKQNTICVELLIKAHDCFVHECYMEGIVCVLQRAKQLNVVLANAKSWRLIVKMLMGIGRYRDMYYCFQTLIQNEQFESLLGQFDDERIHGLKQAIISYLHENCPENTEYYRLAAVHFMMFTEIAQLWETEARQIVSRVISEQLSREESVDSQQSSSDEASVSAATITLSYLRCSSEVVKLLYTAMDGYAHAAENYLMDNKLALAQRMASMAELIALQINLMNRALERSAVTMPTPVLAVPTTCICVTNIQIANVLRHYVNNHLR